MNKWSNSTSNSCGVEVIGKVEYSFETVDGGLLFHVGGLSWVKSFLEKTCHSEDISGVLES